jgi:hypothetical protein
MRAPGPDVFLEDDVLRRGGTDHCREPSQGGRAPGCPARGASVMPEHKGCEPHCRGLESAHGLVTRPAEVAQGCIVDRGDIHGGAIP